MSRKRDLIRGELARAAKGRGGFRGQEVGVSSLDADSPPRGLRDPFDVPGGVGAQDDAEQPCPGGG